jgi:hypothetical protein
MLWQVATSRQLRRDLFERVAARRWKASGEAPRGAFYVRWMRHGTHVLIIAIIAAGAAAGIVMGAGQAPQVRSIITMLSVCRRFFPPCIDRSDKYCCGTSE